MFNKVYFFTFYLPIDLEDPYIQAAATKIQASFKGNFSVLGRVYGCMNLLEYNFFRFFFD